MKKFIVNIFLDIVVFASLIFLFWSISYLLSQIFGIYDFPFLYCAFFIFILLIFKGLISKYIPNKSILFYNTIARRVCKILLGTAFLILNLEIYSVLDIIGLPSKNKELLAENELIFGSIVLIIFIILYFYLDVIFPKTDEKFDNNNSVIEENKLKYSQ